MVAGIAWIDVFEEVCKRGEEPLRWGLPEPWLHAELFAELSRRAPTTGWYPLAHEIPYVTHCPVVLPKKRDLATRGAVKWVDLCLHNPDCKEWLWFEFKVRHAGRPERKEEANSSAMDAVKKDIAALASIDIVLTAKEWEQPDTATKSHWMPELLTPHARSLSSARHHFVMAYLELKGEMNGSLWNSDRVLGELARWLKWRKIPIHVPTIEVSAQPRLQAPHGLFIASWWDTRRDLGASSKSFSST